MVFNTSCFYIYNNKYATMIKFRQHPAADMNRKQTTDDLYPTLAEAHPIPSSLVQSKAD
jgi:hypothetical protein